jgi:hypothetical protein
LKKTLRLLPVAGVFAVLAVLFTGTALAQNGYTLFGDAEIVSPGNASPHAAQLRSDADPGFGGIDFDIPDDLTFEDIEALATDYNITDDQCGGGSPRFQLNVDTDGDGEPDGNIFVYIGPSPTFTGCAPGWQSTGNLIGNNDPCRYDTSQLAVGTQCNTYLGTLALFGGSSIVGIQVVVDAGWNAVASGGDGEQTILVDNVNIDGTIYTFDQPITKDECKNGGWMDLTRADGTTFKNQGDCIQYVNTGK